MCVFEGREKERERESPTKTNYKSLLTLLDFPDLPLFFGLKPCSLVKTFGPIRHYHRCKWPAMAQLVLNKAAGTNHQIAVVYTTCHATTGPPRQLPRYALQEASTMATKALQALKIALGPAHWVIAQP